MTVPDASPEQGDVEPDRTTAAAGIHQRWHRETGMLVGSPKCATCRQHQQRASVSTAEDRPNPGQGKDTAMTTTQPTEQVSQTCPSCGNQVTMVPYDIGSGPEMACPNCEWCWGADGQSLKALPVPVRPGHASTLHLGGFSVRLKTKRGRHRR